MLTTEQKQTIKAWVNANANGVFEQSTADILNAPASPEYLVWRTSVEKKEVTQRVSSSGTSFTWAANGFITRSVGELECWNQLFNSTLTCNPSLTNVRQAFADIFSGAGNAAANRTHLLNVSKRAATVAEKLLAAVAIGPGNDGVAGNRGTATNPDAMTFEGTITVQDLIDSANS